MKYRVNVMLEMDNAQTVAYPEQTVRQFVQIALQRSMSEVQEKMPAGFTLVCVNAMIASVVENLESSPR